MARALGVEEARRQLDAAIARLERALPTGGAKMTAGGAGGATAAKVTRLEGELAEARRERAALRATKETLSRRLDGAIARLEGLLQD